MHNHDFEFVEQNGQIGYDIILKNTDAALVKLQMDLAGSRTDQKLSANEWFKRQPGRFVMWHVKDMPDQPGLHGSLERHGRFHAHLADASLAG